VNNPPGLYAGDESSCFIQQRGWAHGISIRLGVSRVDRHRGGVRLRLGTCRRIWPEQSVLGGMLVSKDAIADVLERLRPRCEPKLRTIAELMANLD
jgi:hypothetical protein